MIKKLLAILMVTAVLLACNSAAEKEKSTAADTLTNNHHDHEEEATGLALDNGAKWKADSITIANVSLLKETLSVAKKEKLEDYLQTASQLQEGLNKMLSECKMKGEDHNALHQWLVPLMEKVKVLKTATTVEDAAAISTAIEKQVNLFTEYFE